MSTGAYLPPVVTRLEMNIDDFADGITKAKALLASLKDKVEVPVDVDTTAAQAKIAAYKDALNDAAVAQDTFKWAIGRTNDALRDQAAVLALVNPGITSMSRRLATATAWEGRLKSAVEDTNGALARQGAAIAAAGLGGMAGRVGGGTAAAATTGAAIGWGRMIFDAIHFGLAIFGQNLVADILGIGGFAASAAANLGPAFEAISNKGQTYGYLNKNQMGAVNAVQGLLDQFRSANNTGVFATFYGALDIINNRLSNSGGIVSQATKAFETFAAMLQGTFSSSAWGGMLGRSGLIQQDLVTLFRFINQLIASIPALVHDFNFLGLGFFNGATYLLRFASAIAEADPFVYRLISGLYLLHRAWIYLWIGAGTGPGPLQNMVSGTKTAVTAVSGYLSGLRENFKRFGALPTLALATGLTTSTLITVAAGITAIAAEWLIVYELTKNTTNATKQLTDQVSALDGANQNSIPAWAQGLNELNQRYQTLTTTTRVAGETTGRASDRNKTQIREVTAAIQSQSQGLNNLRTNLGGIENAYKVTGTQAVQVLQALGLDGSKAFGPQQRQMIANYEQAIQAARNPLTAVQYGMQQAANTALQLDDRITGLTNAFNAMLAPLNSVIGDTVQFTNDNASFLQALSASGNVVGNNTALQRASAQAMVQSYNDASQLSQAILQQTGSAQKAIGPLQQMYDMLQKSGAKGAWVTQEMQALKAAIDALQSKTISVNVITRGVGGIGAVNATSGAVQGGGRLTGPGGFASGTSGAPAGWAWVGEAGPELVKFRGGETVLPNSVSRGYAAGTGGDVVHEINVYLDGKKVYRGVRTEAVNTQRRTGANGLTKRTR